MTDLTRRQFFKRAIASGVAGSVVLAGARETKAYAGAKSGVGTVIDLTKCDGCKGEKVPKCVSACKSKNQANFPEPVENIPLNWPTNKKEDWSDKKQLTSRLTPYNWTYVPTVEVEHEGKKVEVNVPRRCMHCDNPPCAELCPFGVQYKTEEGPVIIDKDGCFGGAKCRTVCPWGIPQRQAGVGLYMKVAPGLVGGGVMYKCDLCIDLIKQGKNPACVDACPNQAITFGNKEEMKELAYKRAQEIGGYVYGDKENGGTSTFYISPVPFKNIHKALVEQEVDGKPGKMGMPVEAENILEKPENMAKKAIIAPLAGAFAAGLVAYKTMKGEKNNG